MSSLIERCHKKLIDINEFFKRLKPSYDDYKFATFTNIMIKHNVPEIVAIAAYIIYIGGFYCISTKPGNRLCRYFEPFNKKNIKDCSTTWSHVKTMIAILNLTNHKKDLTENFDDMMNIEIDHLYKKTYRLRCNYAPNLMKNMIEGKSTTIYIFDEEFYIQNKNKYAAIDFISQYFQEFNIDESPVKIMQEIENAWTELLENEAE